MNTTDRYMIQMFANIDKYIHIYIYIEYRVTQKREKSTQIGDKKIEQFGKLNRYNNI